ncbi:valine--tRNA ligase [Candidatus Falkowbacteria bacterium]|nr:valine--tRNA ligase [Candidatus Falkowbacteria bacterium]
MIKELEKQYEAGKYEADIYKKWEASGYFDPDKMVEDSLIDEKAESYTIVLPPPNITAKLHLGHAVMIAVEGLLIRYNRMKGKKALWVPGTDHAAIATQNVVEKRLLEKGVTRQDLGREKFLNEVDKFLKETQATILKQIRTMGASMDWSREAFTLDEQRQSAVQKMFIDMYKEGVIYRGERVVNWCPRCHSTLADDEVEHKTQQNVKFYTFKYSKDFPIAISTTRPETKLGDTAVAVNPKDERYKKYIGQELEVDFLGVPLKIKIIADPGVDMEFGTGALGVTPAHSMTDYQMALKNDLPLVSVIDEDAKIKEGFGEFSGLGVKEARELVAQRLSEKGLIEKEEEIENNLSICYRCDHPIEPLPSKQWFVDVDKKLERLNGKSIKDKAIDAAKKKEIKFVPERFEGVYMHWMENLHDWCISRQIWFGHRIPAWYRSIKNSDSDVEVYVGEGMPEGEGWMQDEDTLDTWFSSGMWTFSTLGWPDNYQNNKKSGDLEKFHPTQVLETGYEIITLWVSRMIMMSYFALNEKPFSTVYLHGMVLDEKGKKMSKSKGNGIDPLDMVEKFGADPIRLSLMIGSTPGNNMKLSEEKIGQYRNFVNKLWNIARYILQTVDQKDDREFDPEKLSKADRWILSRLDRVITDATQDIERYNISFAGEKLKDFTWNELADWYIEATKFDDSSEKGAVLLYVLRSILKLWHPFIPFSTEAIWSEFNDSLLMVQRWPVLDDERSKTKNEEDFDLIIEIIKMIRNIRSENKVEPAKKVKAVIYAGDKIDLIKENEIFIKSLKTGIEEIETKEKGEKIDKAIFGRTAGVDVCLLGAIDPEKEKKRLEKEIETLEKGLKGVQAKLSNQAFVDNAPASVVDAEKDRLNDFKQDLEKLKERYNRL